MCKVELDRVYQRCFDLDARSIVVDYSASPVLGDLVERVIKSQSLIPIT